MKLTRSTSFSVRQTNASCTQKRQNAHNAIAKVRKMIQSDFASLDEQRSRLFRLALNEAEAIAWQTDFPFLLFPALAEEKVRAATLWSARQQWMHRYGSQLALAE
jgi:hypothetical protein